MPEWTPHLRRRLGGLTLNPARELEIIEELSMHLEERYRELRSGGAGDEQARETALDELAGPHALAKRLSALRQAHFAEPLAPGAPTSNLLPDLWADLRYALRLLRKQPVFTAAAVLTLALGIGANTAIFSLVNATLLQRLPVANRSRLVYVHNGNVGNVFSYPAYSALRDGNHVFDGTIAWGGITASMNADEVTDLVTGAIVSGNFFDLLGVKAERGRLITATDDVTPGGHPVAVLGHDFWHTRFSGRADIVNLPIRLNGVVFTIVGVAPRGFQGAQAGIVRNVYVPMMMQPLMRPPRAGYSGEQSPDLLKNANNGWLYALGLLKPGVSIDQARADTSTLITNVLRERDSNARPRTATLVPIDVGDPNQRRQMQQVAMLLGGVVGAVLLIACANIANLLLSRAASRRRELALRLAIGASRWRIVRQLLTESVVLSVLGGAAGIALAFAMAQAFRLTPPPPGALPIALDFTIDRQVLLFSLGLSIATGLIFGLVPALHSSRLGLVPALKDEAIAMDENGRRVSLKKVLVIVEVALSLVLLLAAGLFVRSLAAAQAIDPGIDAAKLVSAPLNINLLRYTRAQGREFYQRVVERMEALPGVESASVARIAVINNGGRVLSLAIEGRQNVNNRSQSEGGGVSSADPNLINANVIGPGYFKTMGTALVRGRDFTNQDIEDRPLVVAINETAAKAHFPTEDPLGKRVSFGGPTGPWREIVGVVRDSKYSSLGEDPLTVAFLPIAQNHETGVTLYVRALVPPATLISTLRREIQAIDPNLPVPNIQTMAETIGTSLYAARMGAWLLAVFGGLALLLAAVGIYGVLSFSISRRTREMGIRMALGAERRSIFGLVIRDGMWLVGIGVAIGLTAGLMGAKSLASFLYGIPTSDMVTFGTVTLILSAVALLACIIPARRAMKVNPLTALRYD